MTVDADAAETLTGEVVPRPSALEKLPPAYFALVMATGIVSIATHLLGLPPIVPLVLLWLNITFYGVLWLLFIARAVRYTSAMRSDFSNPGRGVGFFSVIAGTAVLGSQLTIQANAHQAASYLWVLACVLYPLLIYGVFAAITERQNKPDIRHGLNGTWLLAIVATQGLSLLGGMVYHNFPADYQRMILLATLLLWLVGGVLYFWVMCLIFYRYMFLDLDPAELGPPYWVDMGAVAISTLAGATLIGNLPHDPLLLELGPFIKGLTLAFWATATWWITLLLLLGFWRHVIRRFPLTYDAAYWAMVFPLGMYTVCTFKLAHVLDLPELDIIPRIAVWIALFAWSVTFIGLLRAVARTLRRTRS